MIKKIDLICSKCNKVFTANGKIIYEDNFLIKDFKDLKFVCENCFEKWQNEWSFEKAIFHEKDGVIYLDLKLKNGSIYENLIVTPLDNIIVADIEMPYDTQKKLYAIYKIWYDKKMKDFLKSCIFEESFMKTTFTCETYAGEKYEKIAFRFNSYGVFESEIEIPEKIKEQVILAWNQYELTNMPIDINDK